MNRKTAIALLAGMALTAGWTACGGKQESSSAPPSQAASSAPAASKPVPAQPSVPSAQPSTPPAAAAPAAPPASQPSAAAPAASARAGPPAAAPAAGASSAAATSTLSVQPSDIEGVEVALLEVKRSSGDKVMVRWQYRNKTAEEKQLYRPGARYKGMTNLNLYALGLDSYLIDVVNKKKYMVITDSEGIPLAGRHDHATELKPNGTLTTWAQFPAPPETIDKIEVHVPAAPPFEDVTISK